MAQTLSKAQSARLPRFTYKPLDTVVGGAGTDTIEITNASTMPIRNSQEHLDLKFSN